jgi:hypothetical protein
MNDSSVLAVVLRVVDTLEDLAVPFHLGGSFASTIHGIPRQTADVDIVVDISPTAGKDLVNALSGDFYIDQHAVDEAIVRGSCFNAIHLATGFKVDFFAMGRQQYDRVELERSVMEQIVADPPKWAPVKSAEDVILRKLQWYEEGGRVSERQWKDVLGVLKTQGDRLDLAYLEEWARRLGLFDLLTEARSDATTLD